MRIKAILLRSLESGLHRFEEYNDHVESSLTSELKKIGKWGEALHEDKREEFFDWYYDDIANMRDTFPQLLRASLFLSVYAFLEHELDVLCKRYKKEKSLSLDVSDLRDKGIFRSQNYLKKVVSIPFPDNSPEWSRIRACQSLRNHMAHAGGLWRKIDNDDLKKKLLVLPRVTIDSMERIQLEDKFIQDLIADVRWLLTEVVNSG